MNKTVKKILFYVVVLLLVGVFAYSAYRLGTYLYESTVTKKEYSSLAGNKNDVLQQHNISRPAITTPAPSTDGSLTGPVITDPAQTTPAPTEPEKPTHVTITHPDTGEQMQILPEFAEAFQSNTDLVAWICIPGTVIDYPVVQTPDDVDYYLERDFTKKWNLHGCIYAREQCDINKPSDNITIYGHRMGDDTMFAQLIKFTKQDFVNQNPYIYFDTLTERHTYEVFAVFRTTATLGQGFQYHLMVDAASEAKFDEFVNTCKRLSSIKTDVEVHYGDKLITLSTCEYTQENGRLVVVAKRVA